MGRKSLTKTRVLAAVGAAFALSALVGAPNGGAQVCRPDQVWANGQCTVPKEDPNDNGTIQCTQHSCVYREDK